MRSHLKATTRIAIMIDDHPSKASLELETCQLMGQRPPHLVVRTVGEGPKAHDTPLSAVMATFSCKRSQQCRISSALSIQACRTAGHHVHVTAGPQCPGVHIEDLCAAV